LFWIASRWLTGVLPELIAVPNGPREAELALQCDF
jgi:hypothetical protein